jgi:hypothetical protein
VGEAAAVHQHHCENPCHRSRLQLFQQLLLLFSSPTQLTHLQHLPLFLFLLLLLVLTHVQEASLLFVLLVLLPSSYLLLLCLPLFFHMLVQLQWQVLLRLTILPPRPPVLVHCYG